MIKIEHLSKTYKRLVLNDISVTFPERQVSVIVGINGSGKTTFLDCVVGLKRPSEGEIWIGSHHNQSDPFKEQVFYIPSDFYLPDYMTGNEYIQFVLILQMFRVSDDFRQDQKRYRLQKYHHLNNHRSILQLSDLRAKFLKRSC